ncbi:NUDIX domain-containing protein [Glycomyces luteolus]|uniref:NUDIX domain-containing protein n=1 Tax=Glycomyces luteolus TaxID=2670330 RepID=A0A9X3P6E2_9ACTN|nr:NUDIX domain-containing protein [Glycomyces luteolus]MDA1358052.1 NUDIX domain-containing protein [Glycomyces luteolus]
MPEFLEFRQRGTAYVLRDLPERPGLEVLVMLHRDQPEAGVQVPGGGARPGETPGETAMREAVEETGVRGLVFGEVLGSKLMAVPDWRDHDYQVTTYSWMVTEDPRDAWDHTVAETGDEDDGIRMRCEFRPVEASGIDWGLDFLLGLAIPRFEARRGAGLGVPA